LPAFRDFIVRLTFAMSRGGLDRIRADGSIAVFGGAPVPRN
jgi:hypothetical protein